MAATEPITKRLRASSRQRAPDGAGPEIADLAVPPHAHGLQHFAGGGGRHDDARSAATSWAGAPPCVR